MPACLPTHSSSLVLPVVVIVIWCLYTPIYRDVFSHSPLCLITRPFISSRIPSCLPSHHASSEMSWGLERAVRVTSPSPVRPHSTSLTIQQTSPTHASPGPSPPPLPSTLCSPSTSRLVTRSPGDTLTPRDRHPPRSGVLEPPLRSAYLCAGPRRAGGRAGGAAAAAAAPQQVPGARVVRRAEPASPRAAAREQRASGVCVLCACRARVERVPCASRGHRRSGADAEGWRGCVSVCAGAETDMCF